MKYQTIVNRCKEAFHNNNLELAGKYWRKMHNKLEREEVKLDKDDHEGRHLLFREFAVYMLQFTNEEVYIITDYLKEKCYEKI